MATRNFEFTGSVVDTSSSPTVEDATADSDVPNWGQTAERDSWYQRQTGIAGVRAIAAADRSDGQIVFESGTRMFWEFVAGDTSTDDSSTVLEPDDDPAAPAGRWLVAGGGGGGAGSGQDIVYELDTIVGTILAAESLADRDAVALVRYGGGNGFRINKAQAGVAKYESSFFGFSKGAVTGTQGVYTLTLDAALVTGNVVNFNVNGRAKSVTFASSSDETLQAIANAISSDDDIDPATDSVQVGADKLGSDDRVVNVFGGSGKNATGYLTVVIDNISITGGASQPNLVFATTTPAASNAVDVHHKGHLDGFTGLSEGPQYYLSSSTAGGVQTTTSNKPVGSATSTTSILVELEAYTPTDLALFLRALGTSNTSGVGSISASIESFSGGSWDGSLADAPVTRQDMMIGDGTYMGTLRSVGGRNNAGVPGGEHLSFNGSTWDNSVADLPVTRVQGSQGEYSGKFYQTQGTTSFNTPANGQSTIYSWSGSSWTNEGSFTNARSQIGGFVEGGVYHVAGGYSTGAAEQSTHHSWNGTSEASLTALPVVMLNSAAGPVGSNGVAVDWNAATADDSYQWSGGSWGSAVGYPANVASQPYQFTNVAKAVDGSLLSNGANTGGGDGATPNTYRNNGTTIDTETSSTESRLNGTAANL